MFQMSLSHECDMFGWRFLPNFSQEQLELGEKAQFPAIQILLC